MEIRRTPGMRTTIEIHDPRRCADPTLRASAGALAADGWLDRAVDWVCGPGVPAWRPALLSLAALAAVLALLGMAGCGTGGEDRPAASAGSRVVQGPPPVLAQPARCQGGGAEVSCAPVPAYSVTVGGAWVARQAPALRLSPAPAGALERRYLYVDGDGALSESPVGPSDEGQWRAGDPGYHYLTTYLTSAGGVEPFVDSDGRYSYAEPRRVLTVGAGPPTDYRPVGCGLTVPPWASAATVQALAFYQGDASDRVSFRSPLAGPGDAAPAYTLTYNGGAQTANVAYEFTVAGGCPEYRFERGGVAAGIVVWVAGFYR